MSDTYTVGVDIGGTRMRAALISPQGEIIARAEEKTQAAAASETVIDQVARLVAKAREGRVGTAIAAVGVCAPGPLDTIAGLALATPTIAGFRDFPLRHALETALGLPVTLEHDAQAAAYAEWTLGAGAGTADMIFVTVSTGIGSGAIVNGALHRGRRGMAGHAGHMTTTPGGPRCSCGNEGCWEAVASGTAFNRMALAAGFPNGAAVFEASRQGDEKAETLVAALAVQLGIGLVNLMHLFSPEMIVLGGGVSAGLDRLRPHLLQHIAKTALSPFHDIPILPGSLGDNAGLLGVSLLAREDRRHHGRPS